MLEVKVERCAGIDVAKKFLAVCVMTAPVDQKPAVEVRRFGTNVKELERLRAWLKETGCAEAVMESTGSYWKPVFNILEGSLKVILANPEQVKVLRGKKTDPNDSRWLASLLRHGLVQASFIPPQDIRELRDLTRRRRKLLSDGTGERNRVQKVLEDANVKIGDVLSDVFGVSGQAMLEALLENKRSAAEIAELAHWRLEAKIPKIVEALEDHRTTDHHRLLIRQSLNHMRYIEEMIGELDKEIRKRLQPYEKRMALACTVPGIGWDSAASILAETGMDMTPEGPFPGDNGANGMGWRGEKELQVSIALSKGQAPARSPAGCSRHRACATDSGLLGAQKRHSLPRANTSDRGGPKGGANSSSPASTRQTGP